MMTVMKEEEEEDDDDDDALIANSSIIKIKVNNEFSSVSSYLIPINSPL